jgi:hypothetical protein
MTVEASFTTEATESTEEIEEVIPPLCSLWWPLW